MTRLCGRRYERHPTGPTPGTATSGVRPPWPARRSPIARPRVRRTDGGGEVPLETYARLQSPEAMPQAVLRRMVRGVSTRDYDEVIDLARDGFGVPKSSVSRDFVRASAAEVKALAERRFDGEHFPVIMIDGVEYAGRDDDRGAGDHRGWHQARPRPASGRDRERRGLCGAAGGLAGAGPGHEPARAPGARRRQGPARGREAGLGSERA